MPFTKLWKSSRIWLTTSAIIIFTNEQINSQKFNASTKKSTFDHTSIIIFYHETFQLKELFSAVFSISTLHPQKMNIWTHKKKVHKKYDKNCNNAATEA